MGTTLWRIMIRLARVWDWGSALCAVRTGLICTITIMHMGITTSGSGGLGSGLEVYVQGGMGDFKARDNCGCGEGCEVCEGVRCAEC